MIEAEEAELLEKIKSGTALNHIIAESNFNHTAMLMNMMKQKGLFDVQMDSFAGDDKGRLTQRGERELREYHERRKQIESSVSRSLDIVMVNLKELTKGQLEQLIGDATREAFRRIQDADIQ